MLVHGEKCTDVHGLIGNLLREEVTGEIVLQVLRTGYSRLYLNAISFWILSGA